MRLSEALKVAGSPFTGRQVQVHLLCGSTPLHLATFVKAHLRLRFPDSGVTLSTGLYGDLEGNLQKALSSPADGAIAVLEWSDIDQRLGFRGYGGWSLLTLEDVAAQAREKLLRLEGHLTALGKVIPLVLAPPTLPLPPLSHLPPARIGSFELCLQKHLFEFLERVCSRSGVRIINGLALEQDSPLSSRHDIKMELQTGFPYTLGHTDSLARYSVNCLFGYPPKKGLITDLDQTLWKGVLGDAGADGVSWSLEEKSQSHALYQHVLASLAEAGVLVAIASKNDADLVETALHRPDLLLSPAQIFPIEASWGLKSDAVGRILQAWNIGADSVVFIDDSPMELAEVAEKHPEIVCLQFPSNDPAGIISLLQQLRGYFGKDAIHEEDRLRVRSLRSAAEFAESGSAGSSTDFLAQLNAKITFEDTAANHPRAFELVNKTNQFNLNGLRFSEGEWKDRSHRPGNFLITLSYEDRFGPLGRVGVLGGYLEGNRAVVDIWVVSCRAFSRNIEFQALRRLFINTGATEIRFLYQPTVRNGPFQSFLGRFFPPGALAEGPLDLPATLFEASCPPLFHKVIE